MKIPFLPLYLITAKNVKKQREHMDVAGKQIIKLVGEKVAMTQYIQRLHTKYRPAKWGK